MSQEAMPTTQDLLRGERRASRDMPLWKYVRLNCISC